MSKITTLASGPDHRSRHSHDRAGPVRGDPGRGHRPVAGQAERLSSAPVPAAAKTAARIFASAVVGLAQLRNERRL